MPTEFEINCAENGEFYWFFKSGNGDVVASSQTCNSKAKIHDITKS